MPERDELLESISGIIEDYQTGEIEPPSPEYVDRWISQFDDDVQLPLLRELSHVLDNTYFSKKYISIFFTHQINNEKFIGDESPKSFWKKANFLDIQRNGKSQTEILELFGDALKDECDIDINTCGCSEGPFIYLDDALFSGGRIGNDLCPWVKDEAPEVATVHILVIACHRLGEWQCSKRLIETAQGVNKKIVFRFWAAIRFENRKAYRNRSEVLWPIDLSNNDTIAEYVAAEERFPFVPRAPGGELEHAIFSSEEGRQLLEKELLLAGIRIRSFSQHPSTSLRPLGYSPFGLGFGSMIITFRNCPNNTPLALWWGNPNMGPGHPLGKWMPLFPRKVYEEKNVEIDVDEFFKELFGE